MEYASDLATALDLEELARRGDPGRRGDLLDAGSFHAGAAEDVYEDAAPRPAPDPDACPAYGTDTLLELRQVTMTEVVDGRQLYSDRIWVRAAHPLPDDPMVQACALGVPVGPGDRIPADAASRHRGQRRPEPVVPPANG